MSQKVYIGNLAFEAERIDLLDLFAQYEPQEVFLGRDKFTGKSRGFAFVTLGSEEMALKAVDDLNEKDFAGRTLKVAIAEDRTG
ncbi:MAG: RNA-binding protein [Opitutae bacterium]|jgi:RNA recognition motif-containing protein|nr:RNA-binding protein [Opitutae bacterium]MBT5377914.1 RNA-binding protein [Opitutae bacterium]MBT5692326.1 RNA-binding protein [Opitutae bacterium]MBT6957824.1 RNA-binding protein [Opitutae bacterium]MBT7854833.1 RNA-binding protein [Opitutae bacterium]